MERFFHFRMPSGLVVTPTRPEHAEQLEELQRIVFPTLDDNERFKAAHYRKHIELWPDGQYVCMDGEQVVGMTSAIRLDFDFEHTDHTFADVIQGGWMTSHQPEGAWLYGADIGTHPEYRRRGIARALYAARHHAVRHWGLRGQVTVGMMSGYGQRKHEMSGEQYFAELQAGSIVDPTVSAQHRIGFQLRGLLKGYVNDPVCDDYGIVLVLPAETEVAPE